MTNLNENFTAHFSALTANLPEFDAKIIQLAPSMKLSLDDYELDRLAIRVNTEQNAKNWLTHLLKCGKILSNNIINGRPIYLIELAQPLQFAGQFVNIIELPFPNNKFYPKEDWEHIELVVPFLPNESTEHWIKRINMQFLWNELPQFTIKVSEPKVEGETLPNPSIAVSFADKSANHTTIKVHPYTIKKILEV